MVDKRSVAGAAASCRPRDDASISILEGFSCTCPGSAVLKITDDHNVQRDRADRGGSGERRAVVLVINEEGRFERLYGMSRARDQLVVCGDPDFIREVGEADLARRLNVLSA
jgi:hypothetical protein